MKNIITAIGNEELNNELRLQKNISIKSQDIQYQEGIFEALDKYKEIDGIILNEKIMGTLELEDLIRSIIMINNDIEIILITSEKEQFEQNENIAKIVDNNNNYVTEILLYLCGTINIKSENVTQAIENLYQHRIEQKDKIIKERISIQKKERLKTLVNTIKEKLKTVFTNQKDKSKIITIIGNAGVR